MIRWPFGKLHLMKYGAILADPPWSYEMYSEKGYGRSPEAHYQTMPLDEIKALPVSQLAAADCLLFMWSTWPHLRQAMDVIDAWGFTYKTGGSWHKRTVHGKTSIGSGFIVRSSTEPYMIATIGQPKIASKSVRNIICTEELVDPENWPSEIDSLRREHSRKPPEARQQIEQLLPHMDRCELFGREPWAGADVWGNETTKFGEVSA